MAFWSREKTRLKEDDQNFVQLVRPQIHFLGGDRRFRAIVGEEKIMNLLESARWQSMRGVPLGVRARALEVLYQFLPMPKSFVMRAPLTNGFGLARTKTPKAIAKSLGPAVRACADGKTGEFYSVANFTTLGRKINPHDSLGLAGENLEGAVGSGKNKA